MPALAIFLLGLAALLASLVALGVRPMPMAAPEDETQRLINDTA